jgi:hypothetical protein
MATWADRSETGRIQGGWSVDDPSVATIDNTPGGWGELTARTPGTVVVSASYKNDRVDFIVETRAAAEQPGRANLTTLFKPDPALGSARGCPDFAHSPPGWMITTVVTETQGVGFTLETETLALYDDAGNRIYLSSEPAHDYVPANGTISEESCQFLFGRESGYLEAIWEGVDDRGNRLAFTTPRLRLAPPSR